MANKYKIDPGLQYLQEIGFNRVRGPHGLANRLLKVYGKVKSEQIWDELDRLDDKKDEEFYEFKNSDPLLSLALSEAYDGDIIRKACNYICEHEEEFGDTILEVGCDCGYMTGFLAKTFPNAKIVSIDRAFTAIEIARSKVSALGLTNVEFRTSSLEDVEEQFDTVFCMRTIQENLSGKSPFDGDPLRLQFEKYSELTEPYTKCLVSHLKPNGNIVVFERVAHDPLLFGWMMTLSDEKCAPDIDTFEEVQCEEGINKNSFNAFICRNNTENEYQTMLDWWTMDFISVPLPAKKTGWGALVVLWGNAGHFIDGVHIFNKDNQKVGRFALFTDRGDDSGLYYLNAAGGSEVTLLHFYGSEKESLIQHIQDVIEMNRKIGNHEERIDPNDEYLEGDG